MAQVELSSLWSDNLHRDRPERGVEIHMVVCMTKDRDYRKEWGSWPPLQEKSEEEISRFIMDMLNEIYRLRAEVRELKHDLTSSQSAVACLRSMNSELEDRAKELEEKVDNNPYKEIVDKIYTYAEGGFQDGIDCDYQHLRWIAETIDEYIEERLNPEHKEECEHNLEFVNTSIGTDQHPCGYYECSKCGFTTEIQSPPEQEHEGEEDK